MTKKNKWKPFKEAREYARSLGLKSVKEWDAHFKSKERISDIPIRPNRVYKEEWESWGDFLGSGNVKNGEQEYRSFEDARAFVRSLKLANHRDWRAFCKSGKKPENIPTAPEKVYKEWSDTKTWLGSRHSKEDFLPFQKARAIARKAKLHSVEEWHAYINESKPDGIPARPDQVYNKVWWRCMYGHEWMASLSSRQKGIGCPFCASMNHGKKLQQNLSLPKQWHPTKNAGLELKAPRPQKKVWWVCKKHFVQESGRIYRPKFWTSWKDWLGIKDN